MPNIVIYSLKYYLLFVFKAYYIFYLDFMTIYQTIAGLSIINPEKTKKNLKSSWEEDESYLMILSVHENKCGCQS